MEIYGKNFYKKSLKPFKVKDLYKFLKQNDEVKIVIYFETTIQQDPEKESYRENNNI
jgi:translation initiation factor IF-3